MAEPFELLDQQADLMIEVGDHRGVGGARIAAREVAFARVDGLFVAEFLHIVVDVGVGSRQSAVGDGRRPHQEELVVAVLAHERDDVVVQRIGAVDGAFETGVTLSFVGIGPLREFVAQLDGGVVEVLAAAVAVEEARVVVLRGALAEVTVEEIEAHRVGRALGVGGAESPFADHRGFVARVLQDGGEGRRAGLHRRLPFERGILLHGAEFPHVAAGGHLVVGADLRMPRVQSREQAAARGGRDRRGGVHVGEAYAAGGEAVDVGRFGFGLSVTAEVAVSGIVHQDEDDVGTFLPTFFLCRGCRFGQGRCGCHGAEGGQQGVVFSFHVQERLVADKNRKIPGQNETCVRKRVCAGPICVPCTVIEMPVSRRRASDEPRGAPSEKSASGSCPPVCCGTL